MVSYPAQNVKSFFGGGRPRANGPGPHAAPAPGKKPAGTLAGSGRYCLLRDHRISIWVGFFSGCGLAWDLITGEQHDFGGGSELPPYSAYYWKMER